MNTLCSSVTRSTRSFGSNTLYKKSRKKFEMIDRREVGESGQSLNDQINQTKEALLLNAESMRKAQWNKTVKKLHGLSDEERVRIEDMTKELVRELLYTPIEYITKNTTSGEGYAENIRIIFALQ
jgi:glutamyl-tRNA reductase